MKGAVSKPRNKILNWFAQNKTLQSVAFLVVCLGATSVSAQGTREFYMGFTPWLYDLNEAAVESTYSYINSHSDLVAHQLEEGVPWTEALYKRSYHENLMWDWNRRRTKTGADTKVLVSISPLDESRSTLADYRGQTSHMALPARFQGLRFNDPLVKRAYLNYAEKVIGYFDPDYLAIAVEPNELLFNDISQWPEFVELYIETYSALKEKHPELPIFFTTSLHTMNQMRAGTEEAWEALEALWNYADIAAVSYYPFMQYPLDMAAPVDMLWELSEHTDLPIAVSESGYPAQTLDYPGLGHIPATERLQAEVLFRMLVKAYVDKYAFFVVWAHRDFDQLLNTLEMAPISTLWRDTGLLDEHGEERLSAKVWDAVHSLQMNE